MAGFIVLFSSTRFAVLFVISCYSRVQNTLFRCTGNKFEFCESLLIWSNISIIVRCAFFFRKEENGALRVKHKVIRTAIIVVLR